MNNNSVVEKEFEHDAYGRLFKSTINGNVKFYLYDDYGNPTSIGGVAATWTSGTLLNSYGSTSYSYNHKGVRYSKTWTDENGTYNSSYYLDGTKILGEDSKGRKLRYFYDVTGLTGLTVDGVKYQYVKDIQGNVTKIYRLSDKQLAAAYVYDAWGNHTITCNVNGIAEINPFRYRSYYYDVETGYYYLQSRYYDPQIGRFISPDTIDYMDFENVNSLDLYRYCNNNPILYFDPDGHSVLLLLLLLGAGLIIGGTVGGITAYNNAVNAGKTGSELFWATVGGTLLGASIGVAATGLFVAAYAGIVGGIYGLSVTVFGGVAVKQAFAIGLLAFNFFAYAVAPLIGLVVQGIGINEDPFKMPRPNRKPLYPPFGVLWMPNLK